MLIPGGVLRAETAQNQEEVLANNLYEIIYTISKRDLPVTLLFFPRLIHDSEYLFRKLEFMLKGISYPTFLEAFKQTAQPELVHDFSRKSTEGMASTADE